MQEQETNLDGCPKCSRNGYDPLLEALIKEHGTEEVALVQLPAVITDPTKQREQQHDHYEDDDRDLDVAVHHTRGKRKPPVAPTKQLMKSNIK